MSTIKTFKVLTFPSLLTRPLYISARLSDIACLSWAIAGVFFKNSCLILRPAVCVWMNNLYYLCISCPAYFVFERSRFFLPRSLMNCYMLPYRTDYLISVLTEDTASTRLSVLPFGIVVTPSCINRLGTVLSQGMFTVFNVFYFLKLKETINKCLSIIPCWQPCWLLVLCMNISI